MSRLSFDHLSTVLSFETAGTSATSAGSDNATGTFNQVLQQAQSQSNSQTENTDTTPTAQRGRESKSAAQPSQDKQASAPKTQSDEKSSAPDSATDSTETEDAVSGAGDPAEGDANRDQSDADDDAEDAVAVVVAAQIQPEPMPVPVDELLLSGGPASITATDAATAGTGQSPASDPSIVSMLTDSLVDPTTVPTETPPPSDGQLSGEAAAKVVEVLSEQTDSSSPGEPVTKISTPSSAGATPGEKTNTTSSEANLSSDAQPATAETAVAQATATEDDSSQDGKHPHGKATANSRQSQGGLKTAAASEAISPSSLPEVMAAMQSDPTAELADSKKDNANSSGKAASTNTTDNQPLPSVADTSASQATSASQGAGDGDATVGQADRVRFVQRVARAFESAAGDGGSVHLRLSPPELGSLRLEVTLRNGVMNAHVEAETPAARNMLLDNLPALRERLAEQNIKVEQFDVDLTDRGTSNSWQQPQDRQDSPPRRTDDDSRLRADRPSTVETTTAARPAPRYGQGGGFDVTI